jgi:CubicO group peptidase (beta-lactamase class C family)
VLGASETIIAQRFQRKADSLIMSVIKNSQGPGGVFMVAKDGKMVYQKAIGKANLELDVDLTTDNVFQIGSMTKQFTAVAILMLEEQGRLRVEQPVSAFVPDYPLGDSITIHHLLTHTSGIRDFTKMKKLGDIAQKEMSPKMMVDFFKDEPMDFKPGEKFEYNNSGYVLLGYIIELVSGKSYSDFIEQHIFRKLGMNHSYYATDRSLIHNRAYGYQKKESGYVNKTVINFSLPFSSGALMSTSADMLAWQNALSKYVLLSEESSQKAFSTYNLNNGQAFTYGYGWHIKEIKGEPVREHGGSIFGFKSMGLYIPGTDIYVLGLTNCDCNSPTQLVRDIAAAALEEFRN